MKFYTITKQRAVGIVFIIFALTILVGMLLSENTSVASANRKLPIYSVETDEKKIAITFDAAWTNQDTDELIEILNKYNAKATFFIVGDWAEKFPESVKAFHNAGHTIANHSDTHKAFSKCSYAEIKEEIVNCNEKLESITGTPVTLVRSPSGDYTNQSLDVCKELNMTMVQWDTDSLDYTKISVDEIVNRVVNGTKNGSILLFHNGVDNTAPALDKVLTELEKDGYIFVSVEDLIYKENYYLDHTGRQFLNDK